MSLSKNTIKLITSLSQKKYRQKHKLFVAEGVKVVQELLNSSFNAATIYTTDNSLFNTANCNTVTITNADLKKISTLKSPNKVLGIFEIPETPSINYNCFSLVLDEVNDPGNLGTIIRLCDWFGIEQLICSKNTVDAYNQKVVQSTMGSLTRLSIIYTDIVDFLNRTETPSYIADMEGENIYLTNLPQKATLVMGNEANGISKEVRAVINKKLSIPRFGALQKTESLNVATATAILLSEFKRG